MSSKTFVTFLSLSLSLEGELVFDRLVIAEKEFFYRVYARNKTHTHTKKRPSRFNSGLF